MSELLRRAEAAPARLETSGPQEALHEALLEVRLALGGQAMENGALWTVAEIQDRLERVRADGEEIPTDECLQMLRQLGAAAGNG